MRNSLTHGRFEWQRYTKNPVFPAVPETWMEAQTANPDLLTIGDSYFMYFRGQRNGHDRIGLATVPCARFDGASWSVRPAPVIDVGARGSWDETHVLDPAALFVKGRVYLYYSAVSPRCDRAVCLAVSDDGIHFVKGKRNPVVIGGGPEIVFRDDRFHLYFWKPHPRGSGFQIHLATSRDGFEFTEYSPQPVLPAGAARSWDSHSVETPCIFEEDGVYYMMYCGSDRFDDYPWHAGVAASKDLVCWKKYEKNPVFSRGAKGVWDEGAIWFTTVEKIKGTYYMWYEGYGGGTAREEQYGSYLEGGKSRVGMACLHAPYLYVPPGRRRAEQRYIVAFRSLVSEQQEHRRGDVAQHGTFDRAVDRQLVIRRTASMATATLTRASVRRNGRDRSESSSWMKKSMKSRNRTFKFHSQVRSTPRSFRLRSIDAETGRNQAT